MLDINTEQDASFSQWQGLIHGSGLDFCSPRFDTYAEIRQ